MYFKLKGVHVLIAVNDATSNHVKVGQTVLKRLVQWIRFIAKALNKKGVKANSLPSRFLYNRRAKPFAMNKLKAKAIYRQYDTYNAIDRVICGNGV